MKIDYVIVGAGYAGCVFAERIATQMEKTVLIVEKRNHIGGNAFDFHDEHGILVHKYGPHIFHTNSKKVWDYLSQFTEWRHYQHRVLAVVDGMKIPVPFNLNSLHKAFPRSYAARLEDSLIQHFGYGARVPILKLRESSSGELKQLADFIYEKIFYGYTLKQWDAKPEELDSSVTGRVPVVVSKDDRYFQDVYQGLPKFGYTKMFEKILENPRIHTLLNTDYDEIAEELKAGRVIYTGPIDRYFNYIHGRLPYRSLKFEMKSIEKDSYQEVAQVNYPNDYDFTRTTEFKHMTGEESRYTSVSFEYSQNYIPGENEPYYPIPRDANTRLFQAYLNEASKLSPTVTFVGRLADYKYYNMDQVVARSLIVFEKEFAGR